MENLAVFQKLCRTRYEEAQEATLAALAGLTAQEALAVLEASRAEIGLMLSWEERSRENALRIREQDREEVLQQ